MKIEKIKPRAGLMLVEVEEPKKETSGGLLLSEGERKQLESGVVIANGDEEQLWGEVTKESPAYEGDTVLFIQYERVFKIGEKMYAFLKFDQVLAIYDETEKE